MQKNRLHQGVLLWVNEIIYAYSGVAARNQSNAGREKNDPTTDRRMRLSIYRWKTSCWGIFRNPQEESECKGQISNDISSQIRVSRSGYYAFVHHLDRSEKGVLRKLSNSSRCAAFAVTIIHRFGYGYNPRNPKTVLWIIVKYNLLSEIHHWRK